MRHDACILNTGQNAWAFEKVAQELAISINLDVRQSPSKKNYLLGCDSLPEPNTEHEYFVPLEAIQIASDKRLVAEAFTRNQVPTPNTFIVDSLDHAKQLASQYADVRWCLKYPDSCGGAGHRYLDQIDSLPAVWPRPLILQEFIEMDTPEVYRTYSVSGEIFGWIARRFPADKKVSPWVAHARGARYESCGSLPSQARDVATSALTATGLLNNFGCVDLIQRPNKRWIALEVGTDGWMNHVDRELGNQELEVELSARLSAAIAKFVKTSTPIN